MDTALSMLLASALLTVAELVLTKLVERLMTVAPGARALGFVTG